MRPQCHTRGQALIGLLMATVVWGAGAAALVRWNLWLLQTDRAALQSQAAALALGSALEMGRLSGAAQHLGAAGPTWVQTLADGTVLQLQETRYSDPMAADPRRGEHVLWTARWEDPWGRSRSLALRTFWAPTRRIY